MIKVITKGTLSAVNEIKAFGALIVGFRAGNKFFKSNLELHEDMSIHLDAQNHVVTITIRNFKDSDYLVMHDEKGMKEKVEI